MAECNVMPYEQEQHIEYNDKHFQNIIKANVGNNKQKHSRKTIVCVYECKYPQCKYFQQGGCKFGMPDECPYCELTLIKEPSGRSQEKHDKFVQFKEYVFLYSVFGDYTSWVYENLNNKITKDVFNAIMENEVLSNIPLFTNRRTIHNIMEAANNKKLTEYLYIHVHVDLDYFDHYPLFDSIREYTFKEMTYIIDLLTARYFIEPEEKEYEIFLDKHNEPPYEKLGEYYIFAFCNSYPIDTSALPEHVKSQEYHYETHMYSTSYRLFVHEDFWEATINDFRIFAAGDSLNSELKCWARYIVETYDGTVVR